MHKNLNKARFLLVFMSVFELIEAIEGSEEFKSLPKSEGGFYLTSAFSMFSEGGEKVWSISYFDCESRKITSFSSDGRRKQEEPFAKEGVIPRLRLEKVRTDDVAALKVSRGVLEKNYGLTVQKTVMVLQTLSQTALWNVTFIALEMKVVNVKVSAHSGFVLDHKVTAISDFMQSK